MALSRERLLADLEEIVSASSDRAASLQTVAHHLRNQGGYRWVGLYDVDHRAGAVTNIVWSGSGAPEYPTFSITKGLTCSAVSGRRTVNVGDVSADPRYLTAFGTTRSEIIVPVIDEEGVVAGTIDVESEHLNAFSVEEEALLEACSGVIRPLWQR